MTTTSTADRRPRSDAGFTLPELVVTIVIMAIISGAVAAAMITSLRTQDASAASLAESHDQQQLAVYLPKDIANAVQTLTEVPGSGTGCTGAGAGSNVLRLTSIDTSSGAVARFYVSYQIEGSVAPFTLARYSCAAGQAAVRAVMVRNLPNNSGAVAVAASASKVSMTVTTMQSSPGLTFTITGTPRTASLGGGSNGGTSCVMSNGSVTSPVGLDAGNHLTATVNVTVNTTGTCATGSLSLLFDTGFGAVAKVLSGSGSTFTTTIAPTDYQWTSGLKNLVAGGTSNSGTLVLNVGSVCGFSSGSSAPNQVGLSGTSLSGSVVVSVLTSGTCAAGSVRLGFNTGVGGNQTLTLTGGPTSWSTTITASQFSWAAGSHPFSVVGTVNGGTVPFTALGPCRFVSGTANPNPVPLSVGGALATSLTLTVTTTGACSAISVDVQTGNNNGSVRTVTLIQNAPNTWSYTIAPNEYTSWTAGTGKPTTVAGTTNPPAPPAIALDVVQACVFLSGSGGPVNRTAGGMLTTALTLNVTTSGPCSNLTATVRTGADASTDKSVILTGGPTAWTGTIGATQYSSWTAGTKTVTVVGPLNDNPTFSVVVNDPCVYSSGSATPNALQLSGAAPSALASGFTLAVTTTGTCAGITATLPTSPPSAAVALTESPAGSGNWSVAIAAGTYKWNAGNNQQITIGGTTTTPTPTIAVNIAAACVFVSASSSASPSTVTLAGPTPNALASSVVVTVTTTGPCSGLTITVPTSPANTVALVESPAGTWTANIAAGAYTTWTAGSTPITVNGTGTAGASVALTVKAQCTFVSGSVNNPVKRANGANAGQLQANLVITVNTAGACSAISVAFGTGGQAVGPLATAETAPAGSGIWTITILKAQYSTWTIGTKTVLVGGTITSPAQFTFAVQ